MNFDSGKLFHVGMNFLITPAGEITRRQAPAFHQALLEAGLEVDSAKFENGIILAEQTGQALQVRAGLAGPQVMQLLVVAPTPNRVLHVISQEIDCAVEAFCQTWRAPARQLVSADATLRYLYDSSRDHAFRELWEDRLGQSPNFNDIFGRSVIGGGIRLVMPTLPAEEDPKEIEIKIESFLRDPSQIFVDVQFRWKQQRPLTGPADFRVGERLAEMESFIENQLHEFMTVK